MDRKIIMEKEMSNLEFANALKTGNKDTSELKNNI